MNLNLLCTQIKEDDMTERKRLYPPEGETRLLRVTIPKAEMDVIKIYALKHDMTRDQAVAEMIRRFAGDHGDEV